jgi:hypothetical protein
MIETPRCRILPDKLLKKLPAFYETPRLITAFTTARHLSLSGAIPIQPIPPTNQPTSLRSILILSPHLCLGVPSGLLPSRFPTKTMYPPLLSPVRATCSADRKDTRAWHDFTFLYFMRKSRWENEMTSALEAGRPEETRSVYITMKALPLIARNTLQMNGSRRQTDRQTDRQTAANRY